MYSVSVDIEKFMLNYLIVIFESILIIFQDFQVLTANKFSNIRSTILFDEQRHHLLKPLITQILLLLL